MGYEKVPHGFGLRSGERSNTADSPGNRRRPASQAQITEKNWELAKPWTSVFFFQRYGTPDWPDWAKGGRKDCVCL